MDISDHPPGCWGPQGSLGGWSEMASIPAAPLLMLVPASLPSFTQVSVPMVLPRNLLHVNFIPEPVSWETHLWHHQPSPLQLEKDPYSWSGKMRPSTLTWLCDTLTSSPTLSHSFVM